MIEFGTLLRVLPEAPSGGGTAKELVVRAYQSITTAGLDSLQLPTSYADYQYLELVTADTNSGNTASATTRLSTAWLAVQPSSGANISVHDSDEAGSQQWLVWDRLSRTFTRGVQNDTSSNIRIKIHSARLYDGGIPGRDGTDGAKGDKGDKGDQGVAGAGAEFISATQAEFDARTDTTTLTKYYIVIG